MSIPGLEIDHGSDVPVYHQIAAGVRIAASDGRLRPGHRLPPTRDLARHLGVNRNTVVAAYEHLAEQGWVHSHTGRGTFLVVRRSAESPRGDGDTWFTAFSKAVEGAVEGGLQSIYRLAIATGGISFVGSYPASELMPKEAFARALARVLDECGPSVLAYGPTSGYPALRASIAEDMCRNGCAVESADILITNGAQQALDLVFRAFLERDHAVVIEEPTYTGALSVLGSIGARAVGVPVDEQGMRPDLLAIALERHRPRLIYVQPTFQNPTGRVMSEARRAEILTVAARFRCPIVEDDWAGDLRLEGSSLPTLYAMDGGRHVIYLSTFSKKLMPGLRVGWVAAPGAVIERLVELKRLADCGTSPLIQAALTLFLRDGGLENHLQRVHAAYRDRRDCMIRALQRHFPEQAQWTRPEGGLFVWVTLPSGFDGHELFVAARQKGVLYSRGDLFHSDATGRNALRLTFSAASPAQIEEGVAILGALVRERLDHLDPAPETTIEAMPIL